jgi:hypothetical protein
MTHNDAYRSLLPHIAAYRRKPSWQCRTFALGNREAPTEIRDTPKVFPNTPKVIFNV